jgi:BirA family biotin operon repressor/biotin-[acetyl-CoA-carboxylase] ligase
METWDFPDRLVGRRVMHHTVLLSTNDLAATLATTPANSGTVILADEQTAGRGQYGRRWLAPPGSSVLMSILLFPPRELCRPAILTAWAAVSVGETILQLTGRQAKIKWPNDVLLHGKKVCGILIEQAAGTVIGIGLNVNQSAEDFERAGLPLAGSLAAATGRSFNHMAVAHALIEKLNAEYDLLLSGERTTLEACWKWRFGLLGRDVRAECADGTTHRGRLTELTFQGIQLEQPGGTVMTLVPETVRSLNSVQCSVFSDERNVIATDY